MGIQRHKGSVDRESVRLHGIVHADTLTDNRAPRKRLGPENLRAAVFLVIGAAGLSGAASAAATQEAIGGWVISCPDGAAGNGTCQMRFSKRFFEKGGMTGDLEVQAQGSLLVPVVILRGLPSEMLMAASLLGKAEASMQFPGAARQELDCSVSGTGYVCAPKDDAARKLAADLPTMRSITVRVAVSMAGASPLPAQEKALSLSGTAEALARLRVVGPSQAAGPTTASASQSPAGLMGMADKALKAAGYPNGVAQLQGLMAQYMKK